jgi:hypothetical protein
MILCIMAQDSPYLGERLFLYSLYEEYLDTTPS